MSTDEKASAPGEEAIAPTPEVPIVRVEKHEEYDLEPVGEPLLEGGYGWVGCDTVLQRRYVRSVNRSHRQNSTTSPVLDVMWL
jgi:hypothetical protein